MQQFYHIDLSEPGLLDDRSGRWLTVRINGLLLCESRIAAIVSAKTEV